MTATAPEAKPTDLSKRQVHSFLRIPLDQLHESPLNPRRRYDQHALEELAASLLSSGQLTPIIVRPRKAGGYELAAGHRRYRAAKLACERSRDGAAYRGLDHLTAVVRDLDDKTFVEVLNIENLQRDDLHPLEEAQGFRDLMEKAGYDVAKIAARVGRSPRYVYDSLTLLKLTPDAKKLFLDGAFERGHAIELARLSAEWQKKLIIRGADADDGDGELWQGEHVEIDPNAPKQEQLALEEAVRPRSVRELKTYINDKVRFAPAATDPMLFPDTAEALQRARQEKLKVIEITYEHVVAPEARDPQAPRIYGAQGWRSATRGIVSPGWDEKDGKPCEHEVLGVVVIGPARGRAFHVCIAKEKCKAHWADWQKERAQRAKSSPRSHQARENDEHLNDRYRREQAARDAEQSRWQRAWPAIRKAVAAKIATTPAGAGSQLAQAVLEACTEGKPDTTVPRGRTLEEFIRHAAFQLYVQDVSGLAPGYYAHAQSLKDIKALGINVEKIVDQVAPKPAVAAAKPKKKAKRGK